MAMQDENNAGSIDDALIKSIEDAGQQRPQLSPSPRIHRVSDKLRETSYYDKYCVPKAVSIGPYHHNIDEKLDSVEKLKPRFAMELLSSNNALLKRLYMKLLGMVQELRKLYEEGSTDHLSDREFTKMMLLDGCFILYYIRFLYMEKHPACQELGSHHIVLIRHDLFLVENQIPFKVLSQVTDLIKYDWTNTIESFVTENSLAQETTAPRRARFRFYSTRLLFDKYDHLLHRLYCSLTRPYTVKTHVHKVHWYRRSNISTQKKEANETRTFHDVTELIDTGIHFKASSSANLDSFEFVARCWWFSADLKLPPITVHRLLNLLAYELSGDWHEAWVISYVCMLDSLIGKGEDVKALRDAGVLDNPLGNEIDDEVVTMFKDISFDLVPTNKVYSKLRKQIQNHFARWKSTHLPELKHDYLKSRWSIPALLGGLLVLLLTAVQTYFTIWSPKGDCDHLCKFLKINHHL